MATVEPFSVYDCSLIRCANGRVCSNLRELWEAVRTVPESVLEHHMIRCTLEDYFELYEFPNDLARWSWDSLGDHVLGEQLGLVDPYQHPDISSLRATLINVIDDRLWSMDRVPWCRSGFELYLLESRLIIYDTGERISTAAALAESIERMSLRSLYYHIYEARFKNGNRMDDFTNWLEKIGADVALIEKLRAIDFYFLNLGQLRKEILQVFSQFFNRS